MEYHKIGERFEYDGVVLEVVKRDNCIDCFFRDRVECGVMSPMRCSSDIRNDDTSIIYKLVEQCKPKDKQYENKDLLCRPYPLRQYARLQGVCVRSPIRDRRYKGVRYRTSRMGCAVGYYLWLVYRSQMA